MANQHNWRSVAAVFDREYCDADLINPVIEFSPAVRSMLFDTVSDAQPVGNETGKLNVRVVAPLTLSIPH